MLLQPLEGEELPGEEQAEKLLHAVRVVTMAVGRSVNSVDGFFQMCPPRVAGHDTRARPPPPTHALPTCQRVPILSQLSCPAPPMQPLPSPPMLESAAATRRRLLLLHACWCAWFD